MYKKIMVPMDGSELAECVLPHVEVIARGCQAPDIVFVRMVQPIRLPIMGEYDPDPSGVKVTQMEAASKAGAKDYLDGLIGRLQFGQASLKAEAIVGVGVAETLADYAVKNGVDLIVIATHGRSGVSRWAWGSVADRILRSACVPVLMVRAPGCVPYIEKLEDEAKIIYSKILVPLDGSELAECVLPHVEAVAKGCGMPEVIFLHVISLPEMYWSYTYLSKKDRQRFIAEDTAEARKTASDYLDQITKSARNIRLNVKSEVIIGNAAESIADYSIEKEADLIVIATHGRSGISRWAYGSVADRVLRSSCVPVLMVRAPGCTPII